MAIRIGIAGVTGRMGNLLVEEVRAAGAELVGGTGRKAPPAGVALFATVAALADGSDVVVDFTNAATAQSTAAAMMEAGLRGLATRAGLGWGLFAWG